MKKRQGQEPDAVSADQEEDEAGLSVEDDVVLPPRPAFIQESQDDSTVRVFFGEAEKAFTGEST